MKYALTLAACAICLLSSAIAASEPCPPREVGTYPWTTGGALPGDQYGWVYLTIGKDGQPQQCGMGQTNIFDSDLRFFVCRAMMRDWKPASDEKITPGSVIKRLMILPGPHHDKVNKAARKRFFADHPGERSECYPE